MKNTFLIAFATALLSACSGPSYYLMSAKTGSYHDNKYQLSTPKKTDPILPESSDSYAPLEANIKTTPALSPDQVVAPNTAVEHTPEATMRTTVITKKEIAKVKKAQKVKQFKAQVKKYSPVNLFKQFTSNTNIALIFIISGLLVMLLLKGVLASAILIGVLLIIVGVVFLLI